MENSRCSLLFLAAFLVPLTGCDKEQKGSAERAPTVQSAVPSAAPEIVMPKPDAKQPGATERLKIQVEWTDPPGWTRLPRKSPMRVATYSIPQVKGDSEAGELAVFYFGPGQGGAVDGNVERWASQFGKKLSEVERSNREVNGLKQHVVEIPKGDYSSDMMGRGGDKKKDYAMLAAIVQSPSGSYFFKLTGPEKSVTAERKAFFEMLDSVKARN
jgi:hypothetical protein